MTGALLCRPHAVRPYQWGQSAMTFEPSPIHQPVMPDEVVDLLARPGARTLLDLTVGAGGHAGLLLDAAPDATLIGTDRDPRILEVAAEQLASFGGRVTLRHARFDRFAEALEELGVAAVDGVLLDLGVSSLQLDDADFGFSFDRDGPLDMRMDPDATVTAADLVNRSSREELLGIIGGLGDEPSAGRVVAEILRARERAPLRRTCELADLVARVVRRPRHHHPATRTFQGLRMAVNDELGVLERTLPRVIERLAPSGRVVVISFHSGEDRVVKRAFKAAERDGRGRSTTSRPTTPGSKEIARNPRARSARLRALETTSDDAP